MTLSDYNITNESKINVQFGSQIVHEPGEVVETEYDSNWMSTGAGQSFLKTDQGKVREAKAERAACSCCMRSTARIAEISAVEMRVFEVHVICELGARRYWVVLRELRHFPQDWIKTAAGKTWQSELKIKEREEKREQREREREEGNKVSKQEKGEFLHAYRVFINEEVVRLQAANPRLDAKDATTRARQSWKVYIHSLVMV